jgi:hypothetical protein
MHKWKSKGLIVHIPTYILGTILLATLLCNFAIPIPAVV